MDAITVIVAEGTEKPSGTLAPSTSGTLSTRAKNLDVGKLRESFARLSEQFSRVLHDVKKVGDFELKEVELQVEISSEGGVELIGTMKAGVKGAVKLTFSALETKAGEAIGERSSG